MKIKDVAISLGFLILLTLILTYPPHVAKNTEPWSTYGNEHFEIRYPTDLDIFYDENDEQGQIANFREYEGGPGLINIKTEFAGEKTLKEILASEHQYQQVERKISIDGYQVLITRYSKDAIEPVEYERTNNPDTGRTFYFIKNKTLYTIATRSIDFERFLAGIRIFP